MHYKMSINKFDQFLQSNSWADFQNSVGHETFFINDKLVIKHETSLWLNYLYIPRAVVDKQDLEYIKDLAKKENCIFSRIDPGLGSSVAGQDTKTAQSENCWFLKLDKSEDELIKAMKSKTRYNIRLSQKKEVEIVVSTDLKDINIFYKISAEMAKRQKIRIHPKKYYLQLFETFVKLNKAFLYLAKYEGRVISANLIIYSEDTATYVHGSSSNKYRNVMAPYLLQWQAIQDAKKAGLMYYDFGGVAPENAENHEWAGITRFKQGFGGEYVNYPKSVDVIYSSGKYYIYKLLRYLNKMFRS